MLDVRFRTTLLRRCYEHIAVGTKQWGAQIARIYVRRINQLMACPDAQAIRALPQLHFHKLAGDRKGQHAVDLDKQWRIILTFGETAQIVIVEEVSKHYDD